MRSFSRLAHRSSLLLVAVLLVSVGGGDGSVVAQRAPDPTTRGADQTTQVSLPAPAHLDTLRDYIGRTWSTLTRSHDDLLKALPDEKIDHGRGTPWPL